MGYWARSGRLLPYPTTSKDFTEEKMGRGYYTKLLATVDGPTDHPAASLKMRQPSLSDSKFVESRIFLKSTRCAIRVFFLRFQCVVGIRRHNFAPASAETTRLTG